MTASLREWFREGGEWTTPEGRRGELLGLSVGLPVFSWLVYADSGLPQFGDVWLVVVIGLVFGYLYAGSSRDRIVASVPSVNWWTIVSMFAGGFGLTLLEQFYLADPAVAFLLAAGGTLVVIYTARLVSPVHDGVQPPRRGVEPPPALGSDG